MSCFYIVLQGTEYGLIIGIISYPWLKRRGIDALSLILLVGSLPDLTIR
jgi:hypothetical protein